MAEEHASYYFTNILSHVYWPLVKVTSNKSFLRHVLLSTMTSKSHTGLLPSALTSESNPSLQSQAFTREAHGQNCKYIIKLGPDVPPGGSHTHLAANDWCVSRPGSYRGGKQATDE